MKAIWAAINLVIAAGFSVLRIKKVAEGAAAPAEKVANIRDELLNVLKKMDDLAAATQPTWDDSLATILKQAVESVASELIANLGAA